MNATTTVLVRNLHVGDVIRDDDGVFEVIEAPKTEKRYYITAYEGTVTIGVRNVFGGKQIRRYTYDLKAKVERATFKAANKAA